MANDLARAQFWSEFVAKQCGYPAPDRLHDQLTGAVFTEFCDCGCNSFAVRVRPDAPPLARSGGHYGAIYTADFKLSDDRSLEIILFANEAGNLAYVEIDCCANSYPVPDIVDVAQGPFNKWASESILH